MLLLLRDDSQEPIDDIEFDYLLRLAHDFELIRHDESERTQTTRIAQTGMSVRDAEALCRRLAKGPRKKKEVLPPALPAEVELSLREATGNEVRVQYKEGKGVLHVHFYSDDQLRAFANLLGNYKKEGI